jgi:CubicO group peptidase (beta-lactamase class C family)
MDIANSKWTRVGLVFIYFMVGCAWASDLPRARPEELGFSAERLDSMDKFYADKVDKGAMAGIVILIARHGKIAHFSAVGYSNIETKQKLETNSIFRLFSMTKPITSVALMTLYEEGDFQLNDPVSKYLPEFTNLRVVRNPNGPVNDTEPLDRPLTIQDIMRHTAGFTHGWPYDVYNDQYTSANVLSIDVTLAEVVSKLSKIPLHYQPGTKWEYGVGPDIQARLVEVLSGMPFDTFLETRLFRPLDMKDTGFWVPANKAKRLVAVHWEKSGHLVPLDDVNGYPEKWGGYLASPAIINSYTVNHRRKGGSGGLVGTAEDYWRFAQMMLDGGALDGVRILSPRTVHYMTRDHLGTIRIELPNGRPSGHGFGLGFGVVKDPALEGDMTSEGTFFWAGAAGTLFWVDPKEDFVVVAMVQNMNVPAMESLGPQIRTLVYSALVE